MNNSNMQCNALQAVVGLFAHSTNTPSRVVELLSRTGLSIAPLSVDRMVQHMSDEAQKKLKELLPQMLSALGYDNLEIRYDTEQPTATNNGKLVGMTTATCIPLRPSVTKDDLRMSQQLWERSEYNSDRLLPSVTLSHEKLMTLIFKASYPPEDDRSIESLYAWHLRDILLDENVDTISQALKEDFRRADLGEPTLRSSIPPIKTIQRPMRTMNISVSSTSGNAAAIDNMLEQGGALDKDLETHIILVHGDLGTGEKIWSLQESRMIEETARDRLQFAVFVGGWFHTRMAMADSLWRLWIEPERPRNGHPTHPHSIFHLCTLLRPREIGKMSANPGFRRTHSLIEHLLLATIADAWRLAVGARYGVALAEWRPTWEEVVEVSCVVLQEFVAPLSYCPTQSFENVAECDLVRDQLRLFNRDGLLYLATTQASRYGDVQRMEELLLFWVYIWRHTKKHKYATHTARFLTNLDEGWPAKLSEIVRHYWLVNPTGKRDGFRGVDWFVERNNYMHKCLHSGSGVNRTLGNLIKQSPLIEEYRAVHGIIEENFYLTPQTVRHPPPVMKTNLTMLRRYIEGESMNSHQAGHALSSMPVIAFVAGIAAATNVPGEAWFGTEEDPTEGGGELGEKEGEEDMRPGDLAVDG
jgi:hypothetical protein